MTTTTTELAFCIVGEAKTAGSKTSYPFRKKDGSLGVSTSDSTGERGKSWRSLVQNAAMAAADHHGWQKALGPLSLEVEFCIPRPKAHYGTGRNSERLKPSAPSHHTKKPDATKLLRAVEDALTGIVWKDDAQIVEQTVRKVYVDIWERQTTNVTVRHVVTTD